MKYLVMLSLTFSAISCFADEIETEAADDPLTGFVVGNYLLVGKAPDSNKTYHGKLSINNRDGQLKVTRNTNGVSIQGSAAIERSLDSGANVLRIRFFEKGKNYEETCLVSGDLDNYARISCYLYTTDNTTKQPGMEVLFHEVTTE
jgi:hypothetical protein